MSFERMIQHVETASIRRDQELAKAIDNLRAGLSPDEMLSQLKQLLAQQYESANAYTNTVVIAGYAAVFALWQLARDMLPHTISLWVGCLVALSLLFFGAFEVSKMIRNAVFLRRVQQILSTSTDPQKLLQDWQQALASFSVAESRRWLFYLLPTATGAFAAAVLLLVTFVTKLIRGE